MKKKLIVIIPMVLILIVAAVLLVLSKNKTKVIQLGNLDTTKESFTLCEIRTDSYTEKGRLSCMFEPDDREEFLDLALNNPAYVSEINFFQVGAAENPGYLFFNENCFYALTWFSGGDVWYLDACVAEYDPVEFPGDKYYYLAPGDYVPDNSGEVEYNPSFDDFFGTYEEAVSGFYGLLDDTYVTFDEENQKILVTPVDWYSWEIRNDCYVEIDFVNKTVMHVQGEV